MEQHYQPAKPVIEFLDIRGTYHVGERVKITYRILDSLAIHENDMIVVTGYPWSPGNGWQCTYGFWNISESKGRGLNRTLTITMPLTKEGEQTYQLSYLQPNTWALSFDFSNRRKWLKSLGQSRVFCLCDSGSQMRSLPNSKLRMTYPPRQQYEGAGVIEELVSLIERRDCALLSHRAQHNLTDLCDNAQSIGHILHNVSKHINKTSEPTYHDILEVLKTMNNGNIDQTMRNIERSVILDKLAAAVWRNDNQPHQTSYFRGYKTRLDHQSEQFLMSQTLSRQTISGLHRMIHEAENSLNQAKGSKRLLADQYQAAVRRYKQHIDTLTQAVDHLEGRNKKMYDIQGSVTNSRVMYDERIKNLKEDIRLHDERIKELQGLKSDSTFTTDEEHFQHIQNLYGKIDEADYQLNQIGQHLRHTNGSKDPTDQQAAFINSTENLKTKLIGLQKSKSSEPTKTSKRKGMTSEIKQDVADIAHGSKRQTQSEIGTVPPVDGSTEPVKLLLKLLTTPAPPQVRDEWFEEKRGQQRNAPAATCETESARHDTERHHTNTNRGAPLDTESSSESLASAMRQLFTQISEERVGQAARSVISSQSFARVMRKLFSNISDKQSDSSDEVQSTSSEDSLSAAMRRLFHQASGERRADKDTKTSQTSITDSESFTRVITELFTQCKQPDSVASSESFAKIMQDLFNTRSDESLSARESASPCDWSNFRSLFDSDTSLETVINNTKSKIQVEIALDTLKGASREDLHRTLPTASEEDLSILQQAISNLLSDINTITSKPGTAISKSNDESVAKAINFIMKQFDVCTKSNNKVIDAAESNNDDNTSVPSYTKPLVTGNFKRISIGKAAVVKENTESKCRVSHNRIPCFAPPTAAVVSPLSIATSPALQTRCEAPSSFTFSWPESATETQTPCHVTCSPPLNSAGKLMFSSHFANSTKHGPFKPEYAYKQDRTPAFTALATDLQTAEAVTHTTNPPLQAKILPPTTIYEPEQNLRSQIEEYQIEDSVQPKPVKASNPVPKKQQRERRRITKRKRHR